MSNDTLKNRVRISTTLSREMKERLSLYSKETGIPTTKIIEKALEFYLSNKGE